MRKIIPLLVLMLLTAFLTNAQQVTSYPTINFSDLVAFEKANPELIKPCKTCPHIEADGGLNAKSGQIMPFPAGANIKMSAPLPQTPLSVNDVASSNVLPDAPSRAPIQSWLGHVDNASTIPPDTYGAVGLNHVVTATNQFFKIHDLFV